MKWETESLNKLDISSAELQFPTTQPLHEKIYGKFYTPHHILFMSPHTPPPPPSSPPPPRPQKFFMVQQPLASPIGIDVMVSYV